MSIAIIVLVIITLATIGLVFYLRSTADQPKYKEGRLIVPTQQGEVLLNDIYAQEVTTFSESGTMVFASTEEYLMTYNYGANLFTISIYDPSQRRAVEQEFLNLTGATREQACLFSVTVIYPYHIDQSTPDSLNLSFCPDE